MEGDLAPLRDLAELCAAHDPLHIVDDPHGTGMFYAAGEPRPTGRAAVVPSLAPPSALPSVP